MAEIRSSVAGHSSGDTLGEVTRALERTRARTRAILDHAADGILTIDADGTIESANAAAGAMFGAAPEHLAGRPVGELLPSIADRRPLVPPGARSDGLRTEATGIRGGGDEFPLELSLCEIRLDGEESVYSAIVRDLSSAQEASRTEEDMRRQLDQAQRLEAIGQLAAGIAHEINTPTQYVGDNTRFLEDAFGDLVPVLEKAQALTECARDGTSCGAAASDLGNALEAADVQYLRDEIPRAIREALEGVARVTEIVAAMKEFSHPGSEEKVLVDLNQSIESTITVARNEWKYVAEMETDLDPGLPPVCCLAGEINQVVLNLIVNAAHAIADVPGRASDEKGTIRISTTLDGEQVVIRISDTGTGIPEAAQARVFDPFYTTKDVGKGTGQGLAIAHDVVATKHGGSIEFETETGKGTTFVVRLPLTETEASRRDEGTS